MLDDYEQAKSEKISFSGKKKESENIALRTKNRELSRQNVTLASDNDFLFKEMKKQERTAEEFSSAAEVVKRLAEYAPEEFAYAQKMANERKAQKEKSSFSSKKNWWTKKRTYSTAEIAERLEKKAIVDDACPNMAKILRIKLREMKISN